MLRLKKACLTKKNKTHTHKAKESHTQSQSFSPEIRFPIKDSSLVKFTIQWNWESNIHVILSLHDALCKLWLQLSVQLVTRQKTAYWMVKAHKCFWENETFGMSHIVAILQNEQQHIKLLHVWLHEEVTRMLKVYSLKRWDRI